MKKKLKWIIFIIILAFLVLGIKKHFLNVDMDVKVKEDGFNSSLLFKGLKGARDFSVTEDGNYYIAYKDRIQVIKKYGKSYDLLKKDDLDINSIKVQGDNIYYVSKGELFCYNIKNQKNRCLLENIPNFGDYPNVKIEKFKNYLYISIGAATNSGIVGEDNLWIKENPYNCDITPKTIIIKGINFGKEKTGAFVPYSTSNVNGQIIPGHFPGSSSVVIYNLDTRAAETFAWGIRNVKDMEVNEEGELIAIVGGMEDRGLRAVKGDVDYIYKIKKGMWYGWPDYSGGDPINSPRFRGKNNEILSFILDKHPTTSPPAPLYQHRSLGSLTTLAIDKKGIIDEKNTVYLYDKTEEKIYSLNTKGVLKEKANLQGSDNVIFKFSNDKLNILDTKKGVLIAIFKNKENTISNSMFIYHYIIILCIGFIAVIIYNKVRKLTSKQSS